MDKMKQGLSSAEKAKRLRKPMQYLEESEEGQAWTQEFKDLAGSWKDLPTAEEIRKASSEDMQALRGDAHED